MRLNGFPLRAFLMYISVGLLAQLYRSAIFIQYFNVDNVYWVALTNIHDKVGNSEVLGLQPAGLARAGISVHGIGHTLRGFLPFVDL